MIQRTSLAVADPASMKDQTHFKTEGEKKRVSKDQLLRKTRRNPAYLFKWVKEHLNHPYPTKIEKGQLSMQAKMSMRQLENWFANERRAMKKLTQPVWLKKHTTSTFSANPDNFQLPPYYVNLPVVNGINSQLPHLTLPPSHHIPPPPPLTSHTGISSEGGERGYGPTCTNQHVAFPVNNGSSVGYHAFYSYPGSMEHPSHGDGTHSAAMVESTTQLTSHAPYAAQTFMMPSPSFNSFTSSSSPQSAYKAVPQVINTSGHSPYAADVLPTPPQLLDESGTRADGRLHPYLRVKEETCVGARPRFSCKLGLYPSNGTANGGAREEWWERCVSNAGGVNGKWEVGSRGKEREGYVVKGEMVGVTVTVKKECFDSSEPPTSYMENEASIGAGIE